MSAWHRQFPFDTVIMLGDNIYGGKSPSDLQKKFEIPYKPLLDAAIAPGLEPVDDPGGKPDRRVVERRPEAIGPRRLHCGVCAGGHPATSRVERP